MISLRNLVLAGTVAIAGAFSIGAANATTPAAADSSVAPAYYNDIYYGDLRYCRLPFYRMVELFGYGNAVDLKIECRRAYQYRSYR